MDPLVPIVLAGLAVFLFLLVLARLVTPLALHPDRVSWSRGSQVASSVAGFVLLAASAAISVLALATNIEAVVSKPDLAIVVPGLLLVLIFVLILVLAVGITRTTTGLRPDPAEPIAPFTGMSVLVGTGIGTGIVAALAAVVLAAVQGPTVLRLAIAVVLMLAASGIGLLATARAQGLRIVVEVNGSDGKADGSAVRFALAKLHDLGTRRPAGLKTPVQTDVTNLPADALTALPETAVAKALFALTTAALPGVPWRAVVTFVDAKTITVELRRNGRVAGEAITITTDLLHKRPAGQKPPDDVAAQDKRRLLVAAAAHLLLELSKRHPELKEGLCGVERWRSLAQYAIATDPTDRPSDAERDALLAGAISGDPGNALARVADTARVGRAGTPMSQADMATAAEAELKRVVRPDGKLAATGWETLELRLLFSIAAARLHIVLLNDLQPAVDSTGPPPRSLVTRGSRLHAAANAAAVLEAKLRGVAPTSAEKAHDLVQDLATATAFLVATIEALCDEKTLLQVVPGWGAGRKTSSVVPSQEVNGPPLSGRGSYDRACYLATCRPDAGWTAQALADLRVAADSAVLREWAPKDPSLSFLQTSAGETRKTFRAIVGTTVPSTFLGLPVFDDHREVLKKLGIGEPDDLIAASTLTLMWQAAVARPTVRRWKDVAHLGRLTLPGGDRMPVEQLHVALLCGVSSIAELRDEMQASEWLEKVKKESAGLALTVDPFDWNLS